LLIALTAGAILLIAAALLGWREYSNARLAFVEHTTAMAHVVAVNAIPALEYADPDAARKLLAAMAVEPAIQLVELRDVTGRTLARMEPASRGMQLAPDDNPLKLIVPILSQGTVLGELRITASTDEFWRITSALLLVLGGAVFLATLLVLLVTARLQRSITTPLRQLADAMDQVERDAAYTLRLQATGSPEIRRVYHRFNEMLEALDSRDERLSGQRRWLEDQVAERTSYLAHALADAESASRAKSDFLARMSHEIRTPMNGVLGMAELMESTRIDARQRRLLSTIRSSGESLLDIINDILDFSKIEAGHLDINSDNFCLADVVEEVGELLAQRAQTKGVELVCQFDPTLPSWVKGDAGRVRQVLMNLAGNAVKFTTQGEVVITARPATTATTTAATAGAVTRIVFEVRDTGAGIPPDQLQKVFDAFTQLDSFSTRAHSGTGLGLAISRQLVRLMGGNISVTSEFGRGSVFRVDLAFDPTTHALAQNTAHGRVLLADVRVLVADDNTTNREFLAAVLTSWRMAVTTVADGPAAIAEAEMARARGRPYELLLLDHRMPGLDGQEVARKLRADPQFAKTPTVLLSSIDMALNTQRDVRGGVDDWLTKPVRQARLYACLTRVLGRTGSVEVTRGKALPEATPRVLQRPLRALLVEDSLVNQEVALGMLEVLGIKATSVSHGFDAVSAAANTRFDVIFMDCQMPGMDGYEATRRIRQVEQSAGQPPVFIVALTANALQGDREKCLAAGMTDFISKPFTLDHLQKALDAASRSLVNPSEPTGDAGPTITATSDPVDSGPVDSDPVPARVVAPTLVLDPQQLDELAALGRPGLVTRMATLFLEHSQVQLQEIGAAVAAGDYEGTERALHALRSSAASLGGCQLAHWSGEAEAAARQHDARTVALLWPGVQAAHSALCAALRSLAETAP
jgi:signal transduction histidine kinase/CheY-like chemotaxis protein/HPt (histidine-containing phosphotransfer) domain-containing protein